MKGVVYIQSYNSLGSGFLVSEKGYIITNHHVIYDKYSDANNLDYIEFQNGTRYTASIQAIDEDLDLAIIKIQGWKLSDTTNFKPLPLLKENAPKGINVIALGHPAGSKFTITDGLLSNDNPLAEVPELSHLLQTSVAVNSGNSGGPLVNKNGQVVGVVVSKLRGYENMNFAIKTSAVQNFLRRNGINFRTYQLIEDRELKTEMRVLTEEEKLAEQKKELDRIELERQADSERIEREKQAEREKIEAEKLASLQKIQLSALQEQELQIIEYDYRKKILLQNQKYEEVKLQGEQKLSLQRLDELKQRELLRLEQDKYLLDQNKLRLYQERKKYFSTLPTRLRLSLGAGISYYAATAANITSASNHSAKQLSWVLQSQIAYRFDISQKDRGNCAGFFITLGNLSSRAASIAANDQFNISADYTNSNFFTEWEAGILFREWLRVSSGIGIQQMHKLNLNDIDNTKYLSTTIGLQARLHKYLELGWNINARYFIDFKQLSLRTDLSLIFRFGLGKW
jgi:hypothetical protein